MAVITLPLGLLQEFTIYHKRGEARDTCKNAHGHDCGLNTIQLGRFSQSRELFLHSLRAAKLDGSCAHLQFWISN